MNILKISKYPPIQGGESSKAYWKMKAIAKKGNNVFILTNSFEAKDYEKSIFLENDIEKFMPKNVFVYNTNPFDVPRFIPFFNPITIKMINKGVQIIKNNDIDIIEGSYLLPYGFVAHYLAKKFDKPLIISHAGSDMTRIINSEHFSIILKEILIGADKIITFKGGSKLFLPLGVKKEKIVEIKTCVDQDFFNQDVKKANLKEYFEEDITKTIFMHFGKLQRGKGIYELIDAAKKIDKDYNMIFFGNSNSREEFKKYVKKNGLARKVLFHDFVLPWRMPSLIQSANCLLSVEHNFGVDIHGPILPKESISVGKPVLVSNEINLYHQLNNFQGIVKFNPNNKEEYIEKLDFIISNPKKTREIGAAGNKWMKENENFKKYIKKNIELYEKLK